MYMSILVYMQMIRVFINYPPNSVTYYFVSLELINRHTRATQNILITSLTHSILSIII